MSFSDRTLLGPAWVAALINVSLCTCLPVGSVRVMLLAVPVGQ